MLLRGTTVNYMLEFNFHALQMTKW